MVANHLPLIVDFLLVDARVTGAVKLPEQRRRLVDLLNSSDTVVDVTNVEVSLGFEEETRHLESLSVSKTAILAAIPRETDEQNRARSLQSTVVGRMPTAKGRMAIFLPPFVIEGVTHGPGEVAQPKPNPAVFPRFFSVTNADLSAPYGEFKQLPIAIVHRDAIAGMSLLSAVFKQGDPRSTAQPLDPEELHKLIARLKPSFTPADGKPRPRVV